MTAWVFAYGSLMWNPGFEVEREEAATLHGFHRALCIYSWVWRGTRERPGLVFGLAPGGACEGHALAVPDEREKEMLALLDARELVTDVYVRKRTQLTLANGETIEAWVYVARTDHEQFAGDLTIDRCVDIIAQGHGKGGANRDYVVQTWQHLSEAGIGDPKLQAIAEKLVTV